MHVKEELRFSVGRVAEERAVALQEGASGQLLLVVAVAVGE